MAGGISLKSNKKYLAGFSYGAADWQEEGVWRLEGEELVLEKGHLKVQNNVIPSPFLPAGTRFQVKMGKLIGTDPTFKIVFIDPNKTPSSHEKETAGEGRMRVKGKVVQLNAEVLIVKMEECIQFDVRSLSKDLLQQLKNKVGKSIDVEIPYSSILGGGSCL
ncbi:MAG: hypothetical protein JNK65_00735 [Deltaproteobacteria bacterium]|nr:hypothetical protein [Deltaproteobacteria bacterium]